MHMDSLGGRRRPRVIIVGGGFGGIAAAQRLRNVDVDVLVADRHIQWGWEYLTWQRGVRLLPSRRVGA